MMQPDSLKPPTHIYHCKDCKDMILPGLSSRYCEACLKLHKQFKRKTVIDAGIKCYGTFIEMGSSANINFLTTDGIKSMEPGKSYDQNLDEI